jgi:hypothetical protein
MDAIERMAEDIRLMESGEKPAAELLKLEMRLEGADAVVWRFFRTIVPADSLPRLIKCILIHKIMLDLKEGFDVYSVLKLFKFKEGEDGK